MRKVADCSICSGGIDNTGTYTWTPNQASMSYCVRPGPFYTISIVPDSHANELNYWPQFAIEAPPGDFDCGVEYGTSGAGSMNVALGSSALGAYFSTGIDEAPGGTPATVIAGLSASAMVTSPDPIATSHDSTELVKSTAISTESITSPKRVPSAPESGATLIAPIASTVETSSMAAAQSGEPPVRTSSIAVIQSGEPHQAAPHKSFSTGFKAAIALGAIVFVLVLLIVGILLCRFRSKKQRIHELSDTNVLKGGISHPLGVDTFVKGSAELPHREVKRHELRLQSAPSVASKRASVRNVELWGDWKPAEMDGRERRKVLGVSEEWI